MASTNLYDQLKQRFSEKILVPHGHVIAVPDYRFDQKWIKQLEDQGCEVFSQSYEGQVFFFIKPSKRILEA
jgi:hypothetical protein